MLLAQKRSINYTEEANLLLSVCSCICELKELIQIIDNLESFTLEDILYEILSLLQDGLLNAIKV